MNRQQIIALINQNRAIALRQWQRNGSDASAGYLAALDELLEDIKTAERTRKRSKQPLSLTP